ncbi:S-layer homology domain-containing protein [Paenibacillus sp. WLX1005]|uniref:S-layer homology domain-containing protein n=1 Tax=Paenibacillus sp. WLX1005 TaxID=3243766 RepID=UPI0039845BA3
MVKRIQKGLSFTLAVVLLLTCGLNIGASRTAEAAPVGNYVYTELATNITSSQTTLNANVTVQSNTYTASSETIYYWPHVDGVTTRPSNAVAASSITVSPNGDFSGSATGLTPQTSYDYQASAVVTYPDSSQHTVLGSIQNFSTLMKVYQIVSLEDPPQLNVPNMTSKDSLTLPPTITVTLDDNSTRAFPVTWDLSDYDSYTGIEDWILKESGGYRSFDGELTLPSDGSVEYASNYYVRPRLDVFVDYPNLTAITETPKNITVPQGSTLSTVKGLLTKNLNMSFDNGKSAVTPVKWDSGTPAFTGDPGTYTFVGTPSCFELSLASPSISNSIQSYCGYYNPKNLTTTVTVTVVPYLWQLVGPAGFAGPAQGLSFAQNASGEAYVSFADSNHNNAISVMKYNGTSWEYVGAPGFSDKAVGGRTVVKFDPADNTTLYAAYTDKETNKLVVSKFNGTSWAPLLATNVTVSSSTLFDFYVIYNYPLLAFADQDQAGSLSVIGYNGNTWENIGQRGFTKGTVESLFISQSYLSPATINFTQNGELHLAYVSGNNVWKTTAQTGTQISLLTQTTNSNGSSFIAYQDANGIQVKEVAYDGSGWYSYGAGSITSSPAQLLALTFDSKNVAYIAYADSSNAGKITVKKFSGQQWVTVGQATFTTGTASELKIQVINGVPHVAIVDSTQQGKVTVLNFRAYNQISIHTAEATNITKTSATVGGNVSNTATVTGVVYGTSADFSGETFTVVAPINSGGYFSTDLTGLKENTNYYVRAYAETPAGIIYGDTVTFKTVKSKDTDSSSSSGSISGDTAKVVITNTSNGGVSNAPITDKVGKNLKLLGKLYNANGEAVNVPEFTVNTDGSFSVPSVPSGTYRLALSVIAPNGERLAGQLATIRISSSGSVTIDATLIDPYGVITDASTGKVIEGAKVTLYWADTVLNRSKGRTPGTMVTLPELPDFAPNMNKDPQSSNADGQYGWMVYPEGDYYILGEKDGYLAFDSRKDNAEATFGTDSYIKDGNIHVGQTIVEYSFKMSPVTSPADNGATSEYDPYMKGYPDGTFQPSKSVSRAEIAAVLSRTMMSKESAGGGNVSFTDLGTVNWAASDIATAVQQGWLKGTGDRKFQPSKAVTRAEMAQLLSNVYGWTSNTSTSSTFSDVNGHWAQQAITNAQAQGVLTGYADGTFRPNQPITRAEAVTLINKLLDRPAYTPTTAKWSDVPTSYWAYGDIMAASVKHSM